MDEESLFIKHLNCMYIEQYYFFIYPKISKKNTG